MGLRGLAGQSAPSRSVEAQVQTHFAAAQEAQHLKDYAAAEREFKAVILVAPSFAEAYMNLGLVYQLENRDTEAMAEFSRALKMKPQLAGANFFLGVDYCKMGKGAKAVPYLEAAVQAEPNRADIWSWLATAQEMSGDIQGQVATINHALKLQPDNVDLLYLQGHVYEKLGKAEVARLEKMAPGSSPAEQLLAESYAASSEWPLAVIHFQNALIAAPSGTGIHVELGEVFLRAGKLMEALQAFDDELKIDPHSLRALVRNGEAKLINSDVNGALQDWSQAISIDELQAERVLGMREAGFGDSVFEQLPAASRTKMRQLVPDFKARDSPAAHFALAFLAAQDGNSEEAAAEAIRAKTSNPTDAASGVCSEAQVQHTLAQGRASGIAHCALMVLTARSSAEFRTQVAAAALEAGDYDACVEVLAGLPLTSPQAAFWRARCYGKLATAAYLKLYLADRNSYRVHELLGDLAAAKGEDVTAIAEYRKAIALNSSSPNLHYSLGHLYWKNSKLEDARGELAAELSLNPHHAGANNDMGQTYLLEHHPEKALPYLNRALAEGLDNPDLHRDLGTAYSELSDYRKADAEFQIAVLSDRDGSIHFKLARVYRALGEKDKAAKEFALAGALNRESHSRLEKQTERLVEIEK